MEDDHTEIDEIMKDVPIPADLKEQVIAELKKYAYTL